MAFFLLMMTFFDQRMTLLLFIFLYVFLLALWILLFIQSLTNLSIIKMHQVTSSSVSLELLSLLKILRTLLSLSLFYWTYVSLCHKKIVLLPWKRICGMWINLIIFRRRKSWYILRIIESIWFRIFCLPLTIHFYRFIVFIWWIFLIKIMIINFIGERFELHSNFTYFSQESGLYLILLVG